jgi:hypothetical protein
MEGDNRVYKKNFKKVAGTRMQRTKGRQEEEGMGWQEKVRLFKTS